MTTHDGRPSESAEMSTGQLVASIKDDLSSLVRSEIELAKAEVKQSAVRAGIGAGLGGVAAYLAFLASILLAIAAGYGLTALGLHPGWAFLILAGACLLVAGLLVLVARGRFAKISGPVRAKAAAAEVTAALRPGSRT